MLVMVEDEVEAEEVQVQDLPASLLFSSEKKCISSNFFFKHLSYQKMLLDMSGSFTGGDVDRLVAQL